MQKISKWVCSLLIAVLMLQCFSFADAYVPSSWAISEVSTAIRNDIVPNALRNKNYTTPITRTELCSLIVTTYKEVTGNSAINTPATSPFQDTQNQDVLAAYSLGIVSGVSEGIFEPDRNVTRQEVAKMLCNAAKLVTGDIMIDDVSGLSAFQDNAAIAEWAKQYVASLTNQGIIKGDDLGNFNPLGNVTIEQSIAMLVRLVGFTSSAIPVKVTPIAIKSDSTSNPTFNIMYNIDTNNMLNLSWNSIEGAESYIVKVVEKRDSRYPEDIAAREPYYLTLSNTKASIEAHPNLIYQITIYADEIASDSIEITTAFEITDDQRRDKVFPFGEITTEEQANAAMTTINIKVWQIQDGGKVTAEIPLTLNSAIAPTVAQIFEEIYNGEEQFPIVSLGSFSWRSALGSRLSEHNFGTAIDINPDQNYCLYNNGQTIGDYWKPYEDPHSITPYGEVIRIFEKYGFTWGGDAWSNPKDYMHFSYFGT